MCNFLLFDGAICCDKDLRARGEVYGYSGYPSLCCPSVNCMDFYSCVLSLLELGYICPVESGINDGGKMSYRKLVRKIVEKK